MEAGIQSVYYFVNQLFYVVVHDNLGIQTAYNIIKNNNDNNRRNNIEDTSNTALKRNKQKKELKKKDEVVCSEYIQEYRGDKNIDSKNNKDCKNKNKIKSRNVKDSDDDFDSPKNDKMKITKCNSVKEVSTTVFQPMYSSDYESKSIESSVPKKKKQSPAVIMYNKYEVDKSFSFGFEIDQNLLSDCGNDYSPPVSIPTPIEYNYEDVVLFVKQGN